LVPFKIHELVNPPQDNVIGARETNISDQSKEVTIKMRLNR